MLTIRTVAELGEFVKTLGPAGWGDPQIDLEFVDPDNDNVAYGEHPGSITVRVGRKTKADIGHIITRLADVPMTVLLEAASSAR